MTDQRSRAKRAVGAIYSYAADTLYEPLVVRGAFRLFGGDLNDLVMEQGRRATETAASGPILDMPIGTGYFTTSVAARHDGLVAGADIAEGMVRKARSAAIESGLSNLHVVQADAHHLPFPDGTFTAILCSNGLPVIPGLEPAVEELARVLAPGKTLYVSVVTVPLTRVMPRAARVRVPTMMRSGSEVAGALSRAGLHVVSTRKRRLATLIEAVKP